MKKDAYYFSHDANAQMDEKIIKLRVKHDWYGYGLYWGIIEMLRNTATFELQTDYDSIAYAMHTQCDRIRSIINDFNLFVVKDGIFYSESLKKRMLLKKQKSEQARDAALKRWGQNETEQDVKSECERNADAMQPQSVSNAIKGNKSKENEIKKKEIIYPFDSKIFIDNWNLWKEYRKENKWKAYQKIGEQAALRKLANLSNGNENIALKIIMQSIENSWRGLFNLKQNNEKPEYNNLKSEIFERMVARQRGEKVQ